MLAADAASTSQLRAGGRVLFGGWGRTHTRRAVRPSSPRHRPRSLSRPWAPERRCLHEPPPGRRRPAQEANPRCEQLPPCRRNLRGWTPRRTLGWLPALALRQRRTSRPRCAWSAVPDPPCAWGRTGPWTGPRRLWLLRPYGNPAGAGCASGSAPAPAGTARCPSAAAPNTRACQPPFSVASAACPRELRAAAAHARQAATPWRARLPPAPRAHARHRS